MVWKPPSSITSLSLSAPSNLKAANEDFVWLFLKIERMKLFTVLFLFKLSQLVYGFAPIQILRPKRFFSFQLLDHSILDCNDETELSRRHWFKRSADSVAFAAGLVSFVEPSKAGLVQFPVDYQLMNTYHVMRSGESLLESQDILSSNPLFL